MPDEFLAEYQVASLVRLMLYPPFALMLSFLIFRHSVRHASMPSSPAGICPTLRLGCGHSGPFSGEPSASAVVRFSFSLICCRIYCLFNIFINIGFSPNIHPRNPNIIMAYSKLFDINKNNSSQGIYSFATQDIIIGIYIPNTNPLTLCLTLKPYVGSNLLGVTLLLYETLMSTFLSISIILSSSLISSLHPAHRNQVSSLTVPQMHTQLIIDLPSIERT